MAIVHDFELESARKCDDIDKDGQYFVGSGQADAGYDVSCRIAQIRRSQLPTLSKIQFEFDSLNTVHRQEQLRVYRL